jgi:hypothetical protein
MRFEPSIDDSMYALGPEMKSEILQALTDWFKGFDMRTTQIEGLKLLQMDFHFSINGVDIIYKAECT